MPFDPLQPGKAPKVGPGRGRVGQPLPQKPGADGVPGLIDDLPDIVIGIGEGLVEGSEEKRAVEDMIKEAEERVKRETEELRDRVRRAIPPIFRPR